MIVKLTITDDEGQEWALGMDSKSYKGFDIWWGRAFRALFYSGVAKLKELKAWPAPPPGGFGPLPELSNMKEDGTLVNERGEQSNA